MGLQQNKIASWLAHIVRSFRLLPKHKKLYVFSGVLVGYSALLLLVQFVLPKTVVFSYGDPTCVRSVVLLPELHAANGDDLTVWTENELTIGNYPVAARSLCVEPKVTPEPGKQLSSSVTPRYLPFLSQRLQVEIPSYPKPLKEQIQPVIELAVRDELVLAFDNADSFFEYKIQVDDQHQKCETYGVILTCNLAKLALEQSSEYEVVVDRLFGGVPIESIAQKRLRTLDPLEVTSSSIDVDETVYEQPDNITLSFNKPIQEPRPSAVVVTDESGSPVVHELRLTGEKELTIQFGDVLERETTYNLVLTTDLIAEDNALLRERWELQFSTSGGPSPQNSTVFGNGISRNAELSVTFDQELDENQDFSESVTLTINGSVADAQLSARGDRLIVAAGQLPLCSKLELRVEGEIVSKHDVGGEVAWSTSGRVTCRTTSVIGHSVSGRPIYAYTFGDGPNTILYVGGMHGNEYSSVLLLNAWLRELDAHPDRIPSDKKLIVIPDSCPDCVAARSRFNANEVDLNRNFPTDDWQSEVFVPGETSMPEGGGSQPLSEPEAKALADLVRRERPKLTLTYHAVADVVISNDAPQSIDWGREYAHLSGYNFSTTNNIENIFSYTATGAFEDWIKDELNLPALLVEMATMGTSEIQRNRSALWYTVGL